MGEISMVDKETLESEIDEEQSEKIDKETESADLKAFRDEIRELKGIDLDKHLQQVNPSYLDWASLDMWSYFQQVEKTGFPPEEVKRFKEKLGKVKLRYKPGEVSKYQFLEYLSSKIKEY